jgi:lipopolysaccharide transport system ATP-binding protein
MASIESLCSACLLISSGRLEAEGEPAQIVMRYMASELRGNGGVRSLVDHEGRRGGSIPIMRSVSLLATEEVPTGVVRMGSPFAARVEFAAAEPVRPILGVRLRTAEGSPLFAASNRWTQEGWNAGTIRSGAITCSFESLPLMPGTYLLDLYFGDFGDVTRDLDVVREAISFEVVPADVLGTGMLPNAADGPIFWTAKWSSEIAS